MLTGFKGGKTIKYADLFFLTAFEKLWGSNMGGRKFNVLSN